MSGYQEFLASKAQLGGEHGFAPKWLPDYLFEFQRDLVEWACRKGRAAIFADCGMGKTPMQLVWAENVARHANGRVLILTPLAVSSQTVREAEKFHVEAVRSADGTPHRITVTNYERLHLFNPSAFAGVVCDESSILKSFSGARKQEITAFMRKVPHRLLATATAAPNDYVELGTSSEALGYMGHMDMLNKFFKNDQNNSATGRIYGQAIKWRLKGHAERPFWRWVCSWARAIRKPSDLGYDDGDFILPPLVEREHTVKTAKLRDGMLFALPAIGLSEQREERRITIRERCEKLADMVNKTTEPALVWCHMNDEGDLLEDLIPDSQQVAGKDSDDNKERRLNGFATGDFRVLVSKPKIGAWGLNYQHCAHVLTFPSHSYEQYYQSVRRCWRFGQKRPVHVDLIATEGELNVLENLRRKSEQADQMFANLVDEMNHELSIQRANDHTQELELPEWL